MNPPKPRRAGVWIRVSTDEQAKGESPENHLKRAQMYCELQGWELAEIYDLSGVSGKTVIDHAEAKRMLSDISTGHITGLIFSRLARLARNTRELLSIADIFKQHGAALVSISENIDTSTPAGQLMYTLLGALAEWERAEISARVSASVPVRAALGKPTGGMGPWGYKWEDTTGGKRLAVDPEAAEKIRAIFQACVANDGNVLRTARYLNEIGLRTRRGASFSGTRLKRILTDESYIGRRRANYTKSTGDGKYWVLKPKSEWVYHDVEPIISMDTWETVQRMMLHRRIAGRCAMRPPPKESRYAFGNVVWCGNCDARIHVYHEKKDGTPTYRCRKCGMKVDEHRITDAMQAALKKIIISPEHITAAETGDESPGEIRDRGNVLITEAQKLRRRKQNLFDMLSDDPSLRTEFVDQIKELTQRIDALEAEALSLGDQADRMLTARAGYGELLGQATRIKDLWPDLTYEEQRKIVKEIVERVDCYSDREFRITAYWIPALCKGSHTLRDSWIQPA